jgi:hypothetical protein
MTGCRLCSGRVEKFQLVGKVYKLYRVRNPFEWSCPRYRTGYDVVLTRRVWNMVIEFLDMHMVIMVIWAYSWSYYHCYIVYHCHNFNWSWHYSFAYHLPGWWGGTCWVRLYSPICCCVFSSWSGLRARGVWVEGVRTQVDLVGVSYLSRVVL